MDKRGDSRLRRTAVRQATVAIEELQGRTLLSVASVAPLNGAQSVVRSVDLSVTFGVTMTASTINSNTLQVRDANNAILPAVVTYNTSTRVATINPNADLSAGAYAYARVIGGPNGVKTSGGAPLANDFNWAFTTGTAAFNESSAFTGLDAPTAFEFAPDGRVFVAEKSGLIKVFDSLTDTSATIFADLRTNVHNFWDRGLLGLALHPNFPATPQVFVLYTYDAPLGGSAPTWGVANGTSDNGGSSPTGTGTVVSGRLSRLTVGAGNVAVGGETVLIEDWAQQFPSHSIGHLQFGPDGYLYASGGDGASFNFVDPGNVVGSHPISGDPQNEGGALRSQDILTSGDATTLDGTIIRINPINGQAAPGNPLSGDANKSRIVAHGLRNPFRFNFRPGTNEIWAGDVGWSQWEEINRITNVADTAVENFGWPAYEGAARQPGYDSANLPLLENLYATPNAHTAPYYTYQHSAKVVTGSPEPTGGSSITGVAFYNAGAYPLAYDGALFFADYSRKQIYVMYAGANGLPDVNNRAIFKATNGGATELQIGPNGDLFYADMNGGRIQRFTFSGGANRAPTAAITADRTTGSTPLTVNFSGAGSTDADPGDTLTYAWDFDADGAFDDSTAIAPSFTYTTGGSRVIQLRVTDRGGLSHVANITITAGSLPPVPVITAPLSSFKFVVGQTVNFSGSATDPEDGTLGAARLRWDLILIHGNDINPTNTHEHPIQSFNGVASGSFVAPDHEYPSWVELRLTATDSGGLSSTVSRRLDPQTVSLGFTTAPAGLQISVNGQTFTAPFTRTVIAGSSNTISAFSQTQGATTYNFSVWNDGGAATHSITAPTSGSVTYSATYVPATGGSAPAAPTNLAAVVVAGNRVNLLWVDNATNETGYAIERRYAGWIWESLASAAANATTHADTSTIGGVHYEYRVRARNGAGDSAWSNGVVVDTSQISSGGVPAAAGGLSAVVLAPTRVRLAWTDNSNNETGFKVQRRVATTTTWTTIATANTGAVGYDDNAAVANTSYEYRIVATNATGDAPASNIATATTASSGIPAAPSNLDATLQTGGSVRLDWADNSSNESGFQIDRRYAGWIWEVLGTVGANIRSYVDATAYANVVYEYRVAATSAGGLSPYSNGDLINTAGPAAAANVLIAPASTIGGAGTLSATSISSMPVVPGVSLNWTYMATGESGYRIERSVAGGMWTTVGYAQPNSTSYVDKSATGYDRGVEYRYRIVAFTGTGDSASRVVTTNGMLKPIAATTTPPLAPATTTTTPWTPWSRRLIDLV